MSDVISRSGVSAWLANMGYRGLANKVMDEDRFPPVQPKSYREGYQAGFNDAQSEQRWISCSERLPEEGERVLATHLGGINPNNQVIEHIYQHGKFTCGWDMDMNVDSPTFGQRYMGEVIAWMPLPEPYREVDE